MIKLITYLAPSIPAALFERVAQYLEQSCGVRVALEFETRISGPLEGDDDPFADGRVDAALKSCMAASLLRMHEEHDLAPFGFARFAPVTTADYE